MHKKGLSTKFSLRIGTLEACPSIQSAQYFRKRWHGLNFTPIRTGITLIPMERLRSKPIENLGIGTTLRIIGPIAKMNLMLSGEGFPGCLLI